MTNIHQLVQSALIAATVAAAAPVHADASFATGGNARFAPAARSVLNDMGSPVAAHSRHSFATGGYARKVVSDASAVAEQGAYRVAGYPWDNGGYKSDGGHALEARG